LEPGGSAKKGVPLDAAVSDIRGDEIALGPNVDLVSRLVVVVGFEDRLSGKDGVSRVVTSLSLFLVGAERLDPALVVHLVSDGAPDSVASHQNVGLRGGAVGQGDGNPVALSLVLVSDDRVSVLDEIRLDLFALVQQNFLEIGSVDHSGVWQSKEIGAFLEGKLDEPVGGGIGIDEVIERIVRHAEGSVRSESVLDAAGADSGKGELFHDAVKEVVVDFL